MAHNCQAVPLEGGRPMIVAVVLLGLCVTAVVWLVSTLVAIRRNTERTVELLERAERNARTGP